MFQGKRRQSKLIDVFNEENINTVRVCLYINNSLDNLTNVRIVCNIKPPILLNVYANDRSDRSDRKYLKYSNSCLILKVKILRSMMNELR